MTDLRTTVKFEDRANRRLSADDFRTRGNEEGIFHFRREGVVGVLIWPNKAIPLVISAKEGQEIIVRKEGWVFCVLVTSPSPR